MRPKLRLVGLFAVLALVFPQMASAQSVAEIVDRMYEEFERQAEGIDDYTVVQQMMGMSVTSYFEKEMVDGRPIFRLKNTSGGGMGTTSYSIVDEEVGQGDIFLLGPDLVEHGEYGGRETIDGTDTHVLVVNDVSALDIGAPSGPDEMDFEPRVARMYVNADSWAPRRIEMVGDATTDTGTTEVTMQMDMLDYEAVQGFSVARRMVMQMHGFQAMMDPEMQAQLEEMERQLANMPESQRAMMEAMLGDRMDQIKEMMGGGDGPMTMEVTISEVRVNTGPPS